MLEHDLQKHVSVHIEKTAGTSVERFLVDLYGKKNVLIYKAGVGLVPADNLLTSARLNKIIDEIRSLGAIVGISPLANHLVLSLFSHKNIRNSIEQVNFPTSWSAVHGHFNADKFDSIITSPFRSVVLRDPLERTISHYKYWKSNQRPVNHNLLIPYDSKLSFREFSLFEGFENFQTQSLGSIPLEGFDVVGVTENLEKYVLDVIQKRVGKLNFKLELPHLNRSFGEASMAELGIDNYFVKQFKSKNELDYYNYAKARKMCGLDPS